MQIIEQKENVHYVEKPRDKELTSHLREALKGRRSMPPVSDLTLWTRLKDMIMKGAVIVTDKAYQCYN